jgi:hypothetical protein
MKGSGREVSGLLKCVTIGSKTIEKEEQHKED